jgi:hypothetical protein
MMTSTAMLLCFRGGFDNGVAVVGPSRSERCSERAVLTSSKLQGSQ